MADIFISYAHEDAKRASMLAEALELRGWSVFWDRRIPAGKTFASAIGQAIAKARCIVVLWSATSVASNWVLEEAEEGRERSILLPVLLEDVRPPLGFRVIKAADLTGWQGEQDHPGLVGLFSAIERLSPSSKRAPAPKLEFGDVFISYAREDKKYVEKLIVYLKSNDLSVWADNRIDYGEQWWRTIVANLRSCLAMVVVMTPEAEESKWVDREILLADELNKPFFPLLLRGQRFPIFVGTQFHDVSDGGMPPSDFIEALKRATTK